MTVSVNANDVLRNKVESDRIAADIARYLAQGGTTTVLDSAVRRATEQLTDKNRSLINSLKG